MIEKYLATTTAKVAALAVLLGFIILLLIAGPAACNRIRGLEAQTKVDAGQHGALLNSAGDAVNTTGAVGANTMASEDLTRRNTEEIEHAQGAKTAVDPAVSAAWVRSLCRRPSAADDPKCRMLHAHP